VNSSGNPTGLARTARFSLVGFASSTFVEFALVAIPEEGCDPAFAVSLRQFD
jgi:hypothetical protein